MDFKSIIFLNAPVAAATAAKEGLPNDLPPTRQMQYLLTPEEYEDLKKLKSLKADRGEISQRLRPPLYAFIKFFQDRIRNDPFVGPNDLRNQTDILVSEITKAIEETPAIEVR